PVSEQFLSRIDELMGYPDLDPHADPIPSVAGQLPETESVPLSEAAVVDVLCVERVSDSDPDLLRHLEGSGVTPGVHIRVDPRPFEALAEFSIVSGTRSGSVVSLPDRKSTRLNSSHVSISYAVFCLKKKTCRTRRYC